MRVWIFLAALLVLGGCGYAPAAYYAKNVLGESVSTEVVISMEDPQNTVIIKDAVDMAVITKFRTKLAPKESAETHIKISIDSVTFSPLRYDINGYVVTYRTTVMMKFERTRADERKNYFTRGIYDFAIEPNAIITDQARYQAISQGAEKGIDAFVAQVAAQGASSK
ncbi:MAG: hypothetical protein WCS55_01420 [Sulfuricurvum sp.]|uniref:LPS assembly lipoprotein LptE n=1 Tax=Sulfuricurvum sp. TaxID=2025608 RepID=UPI003567EB5E